MELLICSACGLQYGEVYREVGGEQARTRCGICDDERQFIPQAGQSWTSLGRMLDGGYENEVKCIRPGLLWSIRTVPKFAIGQRAIFVKTAEGNVLWDCVAYLCPKTVAWIREQGGLKAICVSHPHYYTTTVEWARTFQCKVHVFAQDEKWIARPGPEYEVHRSSSLHHHVDITSDLVYVLVGGHFEGSAVLLGKKDRLLLVGDTIVLTAANRGVSIMWSYPNLIPLDVKTIQTLCWPRLKALDYDAIYARLDGDDLVEGGKDLTRKCFELYCQRLGA